MRPHQQAQQFMDAKRATNKCSKFKYTVEVQHGDGTHCIFHNAYCQLKKFDKVEMLLVYTEHCGYHNFYVEDLELWRKYQSV
jgi:hypothetical protein